MKITVLTQPQSFPAGTIPGVFRYTLVSDTGYSSTRDSGTDAEFADATAEGNYTVTVQRFDANDVALGAAISGSVTISGDGSVTVDVPASLSISLV